MTELFKCEYCGRFISHKNIDAHFDGDKTIIDSRMHYTGYPESEPWGNLYWHIECEKKRQPKDQKMIKLREFWISYSESEVNSDTVLTLPPTHEPNWYTHVIEYSALAEKDAEIERLRDEVRQYLIDGQEPIERSQEAAHYNWLDDKNHKLSKEIESLKSELAEKDAVLEWYGDESSWKTLKHCENDTLSKIRTDASDYDSYGYSEYDEASRLMLVGGKRAREVMAKFKKGK